MQINIGDKSSIRKAFGNALANQGAVDTNIVVLDADLACSTQTKIFADKFPDRFFNFGIAEQDMVATAAGLATMGKTVFAASFAMFATGRTYDQIRNSVCYPELNVKIIGTHGGITVGEDGATHQALEDISLMRQIPHMSVIVPADSKECEEVIKYAATNPGPMYIRISRSNVINIFDENYKFEFGKAKVLKEGKDISVFSNGETLAECLIAAEELEKENISVKVINVPVVKPLDTDTVIECAKQTKFVITVENHSNIGGLGSAICECLSAKYPSRVIRLGIEDEFGQSGKSDELMEYYGLNSVMLVKRIRSLYKKYN